MRGHSGHPFPHAELLLQARAGEPAARDGLFNLFAPLVRRTLAPYHSDRELFEELEGESYVLFDRLLRQYDPDRGVTFAAYLRAMLPPSVHTFARSYRRSVIRALPLDGPPADIQPGPPLSSQRTSARRGISRWATAKINWWSAR